MQVESSAAKQDGSVILLDGGMATYLQSQFQIEIPEAEEANITRPEVVMQVHREYIAAGADAILTNTYAANTISQKTDQSHVDELIDAACINAKAAAESTGVEVYACIGPIPGELGETLPEYEHIVDRFLHNGIRNFMLQTFSEADVFGPLARYLKRQEPEAFLICQATVMPEGYSLTGVSAQKFADIASRTPEIDAFGFNCTCGPGNLYKILLETDFHGKPIALMPNAGYPGHEGGRTVYASDPEYFAERLGHMAENGAVYLGGCCGTTPAHIAAAARVLRNAKAQTQLQRVFLPRERAQAPPAPVPYLAVELDPPLEAEGSEQFFCDAKRIAHAGADVLTIADCPVGRARGDSSLLASMLHYKYGIEAVPHLTCRDRNLNASKALLLGLHMAEVRSILLVTGDQLPVTERDSTRSVFHFNSVNYAGLVDQLNDTMFQSRPFRIMGALNVNAVSFDAEMEKAWRKSEAGMTAFLTQPVMDERARDNLQRAREELRLPVLAGVMPIVSYRNACFINNEMAGITIPEEVLKAYEGKSRDDAAKLAVDLSLENASKLLGRTDGFYVVTMLRRADISCRITKEIRSWLS